MYQIHHLSNSRSQRIIWLLELVNAEYQIVVYKRDSSTNLAPAGLRKIHPLGRAPVLVDGSVVIAESGAICDYIARKHQNPALMPNESSDDFNQVQFWSHYAEGSFMPSLVTSMVLEKARAKASPFFVRLVANKIIDGVMNAYFASHIKQNLLFLDAHLETNTWLVGGSLSLADIQMSFAVEALHKAQKLGAYDNIRAYVGSIQADESHQRAMQKMSKAEASANN